MSERIPEEIAEEDFVVFYNKCFYYDKKLAVISIDMQENLIYRVVKNKDFLIRYNQRIFNLCKKNKVDFFVINTESFKYGNNIYGFSEDYDDTDAITWMNKSCSIGLKDINLIETLQERDIESVFVTGIYTKNCIFENLFVKRNTFYIGTSFAGLCTNIKTSSDWIPWKKNNVFLKKRVINMCNVVLRQ
jgi:hypothetical protein